MVEETRKVYTNENTEKNWEHECYSQRIRGIPGGSIPITIAITCLLPWIFSWLVNSNLVYYIK